MVHEGRHKMKTLQKVPIEPVFVDIIPDVLEFGKLYVCKALRTANHLCLCGCGKEVVTPLNNRGWELTELPDGKVTLSPSIGNFQSCNTHYIIVKNIANFVQK
jgi:hypothetical protein